MSKTRTLCIRLLLWTSMLQYGESMASTVEGKLSNPMELAVSNGIDAPTLYRFGKPGENPDVTSLDRNLNAKLGSVWKLFVYFYLIENKLNPPPYTCNGQSSEEKFCCKKGEQIQMDPALYHSCGLYFAPARLSISSQKWKYFWTEAIDIDYPWLSEIASMRPDSEIPVPQLLSVLNRLKSFSETYRKTNQTLAMTTISGTAADSFEKLGSTLRVKTYTWESSPDDRSYTGGFAGWLVDGRSIWVRAKGTSRKVIHDWSKEILSISSSGKERETAECIRVSFFDKYPIKDITGLESRKRMGPGPISGPLRIEFESGQTIDIKTPESMNILANTKGRISIEGEFSLNDYVARVMDREVQFFPIEAARSFAIAIRTYLFQNARVQKGCLTIADSSALQRVSPEKASFESLAIARWSDRLWLEGIPNIRYHSYSSSKNVMSWQQAKTMANQGANFRDILGSAYPLAKIEFKALTREAKCARAEKAENWLAKEQGRWTARLGSTPGFQAPVHPKICNSTSGSAYSQVKDNTIFSRFTGETEDQISIAHEYLHLAFQYHPKGKDEHFIEKTARELILNDIY